MNSKELSESFGVQHRHVLKMISDMVLSGEMEDADFINNEYVSPQNKKLPCFDLSNDALIYMLTSKRSFYNSPAKRLKVVKLLDEIGCESRVVIGAKDRYEDSFHNLMVSFLGDFKIIRQYPVSGNFVDFYLPDFDLFVEYDEEHHFSNSQKEKDGARWSKIKMLLTEKREGIAPWFVRVKKGKEIEGLRVIAGIGCLNATHKMISVVDEYSRECI